MRKSTLSYVGRVVVALACVLFAMVFLFGCDSTYSSPKSTPTTADDGIYTPVTSDWCARHGKQTYRGERDNEALKEYMENCLE